MSIPKGYKFKPGRKTSRTFTRAPGRISGPCSEEKKAAIRATLAKTREADPKTEYLRIEKSIAAAKARINPANANMHWGQTYEEWTEAVKKRDNFTCQHCRKENLQGKACHAHHIKSWDNFPELRYVLNNGVTLCCSCHSKAHDFNGTTRWSKYDDRP